VSQNASSRTPRAAELIETDVSLLAFFMLFELVAVSTVSWGQGFTRIALK